MEKNTPLIVTVNGWSGSGKTTFCESLIKLLVGRGFRVAAAKSTHQQLNIDKPGSDSSRFSEAGAMGVCLNARNSMTLFYNEPVDDAGGLAALFPGTDFIIAEGFRTDYGFRIELAGDAEAADSMKNPAESADLIMYSNASLAGELMLKCAQESKETDNFALLHRDQISEAADLLCSILDRPVESR